MTAEIVSLTRARKARSRAEARARAEANALKHGRSKMQKAIDMARAEKARRDLDGHERDPKA